MSGEAVTARSALRSAALSVAYRVGLTAGARAVDERLGRTAGASIRVVNLHGTASRHAAPFREQVAWVSRRFELLTPEVFFRITSGSMSGPSRPSVVFTFDDGLRSNLEVAAPILESFGTRGLFFVCPAFSQREEADARRFFYERIEPETPASAEAEDWTPLTRPDIRELHRSGHTVGNHTWSHARLSQVSLRDLPQEIDRAADILEQWIDAPCEAFAWTFAWNAISPPAHARAIRRHRYCFSACPGTNRTGHIDPKLVFRTHVEAEWTVDEYAFFYSGLADPVWATRRRALRRILAVGA